MGNRDAGRDVIGTRIGGRYRILEKLGEGGMAVVYLAEHLHLKRREAIKILRPGLATDAESVARFRREARAANRLQHKSIVSIYDFGQLRDGRFYLAMEYARGESLAALLRRVGPLPVTRVISILLELAEAIDHAHSRGVIHRDLKPSNMIFVESLRHEDVLKVLDFGIAKIVAPDYESVGLTRQGEVYGTPGYMAPEQFFGNGNDPRIDIYALGCVGFELLTGSVPFGGGWAEVMQAITQESTPRPSERRPNVDTPAELDAIILRCLEREADRRFQTGREVAYALEQLAGDAGGKSTGRQSTGRKSYPCMRLTELPPVPSSGGFDDVPTDAETHRMVRTPDDADSTWDMTAEAAPLAAYADTELLPLEVALVEYQDVIRELGELLLDLGCGDLQLALHVTNRSAAESSLAHCISEIEALEARGNAAEQYAREREASLRFAIGELQFERDQAWTRFGQVDPDVDRQIHALEESVAQVASELGAELARVEERGIALASARASKEDALATILQSIEGLVVEMAPRFEADPLVAPLYRRLRASRAKIAAAKRREGQR